MGSLCKSTARAGPLLSHSSTSTPGPTAAGARPAARCSARLLLRRVALCSSPAALDATCCGRQQAPLRAGGRACFSEGPAVPSFMPCHQHLRLLHPAASLQPWLGKEPCLLATAGARLGSRATFEKHGGREGPGAAQAAAGGAGLGAPCAAEVGWEACSGPQPCFGGECLLGFFRSTCSSQVDPTVPSLSR